MEQMKNLEQELEREHAAAQKAKEAAVTAQRQMRQFTHQKHELAASARRTSAHVSSLSVLLRSLKEVWLKFVREQLTSGQAVQAAYSKLRAAHALELKRVTADSRADLEAVEARQKLAKQKHARQRAELFNELAQLRAERDEQVAKGARLEIEAAAHLSKLAEAEAEAAEQRSRLELLGSLRSESEQTAALLSQARTDVRTAQQSLIGKSDELERVTKARDSLLRVIEEKGAEMDAMIAENSSLNQLLADAVAARQAEASKFGATEALLRHEIATQEAKVNEMTNHWMEQEEAKLSTNEEIARLQYELRTACVDIEALKAAHTTTDLAAQQLLRQVEEKAAEQAVRAAEQAARATEQIVALTRALDEAHEQLEQERADTEQQQLELQLQQQRALQQQQEQLIIETQERAKAEQQAEHDAVLQDAMSQLDEMSEVLELKVQQLEQSRHEAAVLRREKEDMTPPSEVKELTKELVRMGRLMGEQDLAWRSAVDELSAALGHVTRERDQLEARLEAERALLSHASLQTHEALERRTQELLTAQADLAQQTSQMSLFQAEKAKLGALVSQSEEFLRSSLAGFKRAAGEQGSIGMDDLMQRMEVIQTELELKSSDLSRSDAELAVARKRLALADSELDATRQALTEAEGKLAGFRAAYADWEDDSSDKRHQLRAELDEYVGRPSPFLIPYLRPARGARALHVHMCTHASLHPHLYFMNSLARRSCPCTAQCCDLSATVGGYRRQRPSWRRATQS